MPSLSPQISGNLTVLSNVLIEASRTIEEQWLLGGLHNHGEWHTVCLTAAVLPSFFLFERNRLLQTALRGNSRGGIKNWSASRFVSWNEYFGYPFGSCIEDALRFYKSPWTDRSLPLVARCLCEMAARRQQADLLEKQVRDLRSLLPTRSFQQLNQSREEAAWRQRCRDRCSAPGNPTSEVRHAN